LFSTTELQVLAALAEGLTLTQIGEDLALSHSSVSKLLRGVELKSGLRLLEHEGRRLKLTSSGIELAHTARAVVDELLDVDRTVNALREGTIGSVRILTGATPAVSLMPRLVARFLQAEPDARPILRIDRGDVWTRFAREGYDFAVGRGKPRRLATAQTRFLLDDDIVLFAPARHELGAPSTRAPTWADVRDQTLIGPFSSPLFSAALEQLNRRGFRGHTLEVDSYASVAHMVELGAGIGLHYRLALTHELACRRVVIVGGTELTARVPYWMAIRSGARTAGVIERLESLLLEDVAVTFGS
jgi:DNA-binding transcriptional LysR family regulator